MSVKVSVVIPVYNVERYIRKMLESVRNQRFRDFEAVIINDGSTDGSQEIINEFCDKDPRFRSYMQENAGVAAARNFGLERAEGEYIVFYDPDDFIPPEALYKLYKTASKNKADLVIGMINEVDMGRSKLYMHSVQLSKCKYIDKASPYFLGAWSVCNKMFRRSVIVDNNIRFKKIKNGEDGVFSFELLPFCEIICGCHSVVYHYLKRPLGADISATQKVTKESFAELLDAHKNILKGASAIAAENLNADEGRKYLQTLYYRFIEGELINGFYRNIWRAEAGMLSLLNEKLTEYRTHITDEQWEKIKKKHWDIEMENGFADTKKLAENPLLSFVVPAGISEDRLCRLMTALYYQSMPSFEVCINDEKEADIAARTFDMINISYGSRPKGKYVAELNEAILHDRMIVKKTIEKKYRDKEKDRIVICIDEKHIGSRMSEAVKFKLKQYITREDISRIRGLLMRKSVK